MDSSIPLLSHGRVNGSWIIYCRLFVVFLFSCFCLFSPILSIVHKVNGYVTRKQTSSTGFQWDLSENNEMLIVGNNGFGKVIDFLVIKF